MLLLASYSGAEQKHSFITRAATKLDLLKFFMQAAWELKCLDHKQYASLSIPLHEVGKMIGGWKNHYKTPLTRTRREVVYSRRGVAETNEGPVVIPVVIEPVVVELAVLVNEDRIRHIEVAVGIAPAGSVKYVQHAVQITISPLYSS